MPTNTLVVKIDRSLRQKRNLPDAAVGNWRIGFKNAQRITTIVAVANQRVVGVYDTSGAFIIPSGPDAGRIRFRSLTELPQSQWTPFVKMEPFSFNSACKYI